MQALTTLRANLGRLTPRDQAFAGSLLSQADYRPLTAKQRFWVEKLAERASGQEAPAPVVTVGDMAPVVAMLRLAGNHLKRPKLRLVTAEGLTLRLTVAGPASRNAGSINVTSNSGDYDARRWYGRIDQDGVYHPSRRFDDTTQTAIATVLKALANDPVGTARAYGRLTGNCMFCGLPLTDPRSTEVGYGPICAGHYNLPWGE